MLKYVFDRTMAFAGLLVFWPVLLVVAILIKIRMPDGPVIFRQRRVGRYGKIFTMYKFRTMIVDHGGSNVSVAGENRITPLGHVFANTNSTNCPSCGMSSSATCPLSGLVRMFPDMPTPLKAKRETCFVCVPE